MLGSIIAAPFFWYSLMRFSWIRCSLLCMLACQSVINGMLRNMSLLKTRLPGLLPNMECTPACMACTAIDYASSTYCAAFSIFCGGLPCSSVLRTFPTVVASFTHSIRLWTFCSSAHISDVTIFVTAFGILVLWILYLDHVCVCVCVCMCMCVHNAKVTDNVSAKIVQIFLLQCLIFCHQFWWVWLN